jgi:hypothetical protein
MSHPSGKKLHPSGKKFPPSGKKFPPSGKKARLRRKITPQIFLTPSYRTFYQNTTSLLL